MARAWNGIWKEVPTSLGLCGTHGGSWSMRGHQTVDFMVAVHGGVSGLFQPLTWASSQNIQDSRRTNQLPEHGISDTLYSVSKWYTCSHSPSATFGNIPGAQSDVDWDIYRCWHLQKMMPRSVLSGRQSHMCWGPSQLPPILSPWSGFPLYTHL